MPIIHPIHLKVFDPFARICTIIAKRYQKDFSILFDVENLFFSLRSDYEDGELGTTIEQRFAFLTAKRVSARVTIDDVSFDVVVENCLKTIAYFTSPIRGKYNAHLAEYDGKRYNVAAPEAFTTTAVPIVSAPFVDSVVIAAYRPLYQYVVVGVNDKRLLINGPFHGGIGFGEVHLNQEISIGERVYPCATAGVSQIADSRSEKTKEVSNVKVTRVVKEPVMLKFEGKREPLVLSQNFGIFDGSAIDAESYLLLLKYQVAVDLYSTTKIDVDMVKIGGKYFVKQDQIPELMSRISSVLLTNEIFKNWCVNDGFICLKRGDDFGKITGMSKSSSCMILSLARLSALLWGHDSMASTLAALNSLASSAFDIKSHVFVGHTADQKPFAVSVYENGFACKYVLQRKDYSLSELPEGLFLLGYDPYSDNRAKGEPDHWIVAERKAGDIFAVYDPYQLDPVPVGTNLTRALKNSTDNIFAHFSVKES